MQSAHQRIATIHQIVPAHPLWSIETHSPDREQGGLVTYPVAVWALVEGHDGKRFVVGMGPDTSPLEPDEETPHPSVDPELFPPDESFRRYVWMGQ